MAEELSDFDLMARIASGDDRAFQSLFERHYQRVLNIVYRFLGSESEAEDIAQEAFMRIYKAASRYEPTAAFTTWLFQIVANLCFNVRRKRGRSKLRLVSGSDDEHDPLALAPDDNAIEGADAALISEDARLVREALAEIPDNQRLALILMHFEQQSQAEIAEALGITPNAAKQLCHRARGSLRERLEERMEE